MNAPITDAGDVMAQGGTLSTSDTEPFSFDDSEPNDLGEPAKPARPSNVRELRAVEPTEQPVAAWMMRLSRDEDGNTRSTLPNAILILQHDAEMQGVFGYDERGEAPMLLKPPPFKDVPDEQLQGFPRAPRDTDDARFLQWLEERYRVSISLQNMHAAINTVADVHRFDRVRDYLTGKFAWDRRKRLSRWLIDYLGAEDAAYTEAVGRKWIISAVARALQPGCKVDHVLVLEGPQGLGKSSALKALAGEEHFGDDVPAVGTKDAQQYLGDLWIIELAEMDAASKAEASTLKRFLTTTHDRYRPPYGRRNIVHARRCVFAGSVNLDEYLRDPTGGRRFWPVKCTSIDLDALKRDRDQLWAEAVAAYRAGESWHLDNESMVADAAEQQAKRAELDPWQERIAKYLHHETAAQFVTTAHVLERALGFEQRNVTKREANRVGSIMKALSWEYGEGDERQRGWHRPMPEVRG